MILTTFLRKGALVLSGLLAIGSVEAAPKTTGELIVKFKDGATDAQIETGLKNSKLKVKKHVQSQVMKDKGDRGLTLVETELSPEEAVAQLRNDPAVEFAEPNYIYTHRATSNDPYVAQNYTWGLYGDTSSPASIYGSQAAEAWAAGYTGTNGVYVAVIDEGINVTHPDLAANIWQNPFDPVDGIDNDGNGFVDDVNGWNFYSNNNQVDVSGDSHATHVAGTIGARGGNATGVAGVNWNVTILSGKFLGPDGGDTLAAVEAIDYFVDLKKRHNLNLVAINASWGGGGYSQALHSSIIRAAKAGILFVAAAGNDASNNDAVADYPANIDTRVGTSTDTAASFDGVISVAAIDSNGALATFSNYGSTKVDLGAPGVDILSTYPGNAYYYMSGTSMATPHVTGAAALYASTHPGTSASAIRTALLGSVVATPSLVGKTVTGGRLNLSTVIAPTTTPPPTVTVPLAPTGVSATTSQATVAGVTTATIKWSASAGAVSYTIKRSTTSADTGTVIATGITSTSYAIQISGTVGYYYKVVAVNSGGSSADSASVRATGTSPAPTSLSVSALSKSLKLVWKDGSANEAGFALEYWTGSTWAEFGRVAANTTSVTVTGLATGWTYYFRVRAYSGSTYTAYSNTGSGAPL
jgi:subtilisin family serine protease